MKTCTRCKQTKPLDQFYPNKGSRDGRRASCKACQKQGVADWRKRPGNWEKHKRNSANSYKAVGYAAVIKRRYRITKDDFDRRLAEQGGVCAICGSDEARHGRSGAPLRGLVVDHVTEGTETVVRGLLCTDCNTGIGQFAHDPELLERAAQYLEGGADSRSS